MNECILRISRSLALRAAHRHNIGPRERHGSEGTVVDGGCSRERMLRRGVVVARGPVVRGEGGGMVLNLKGSAKRGSTSLIYSPVGSWKAMLWMAAWRLLKKKRGMAAVAAAGWNVVVAVS